MNFEFVEKYKDCGLALPERATQGSAGYDLAAAEDYIIPSYLNQMEILGEQYIKGYNPPVTLAEMASITKATGAKPTLVSTGVKCKMEEGQYLELSVRSSTPLKHWLILANGVGRLQ